MENAVEAVGGRVELGTVTWRPFLLNPQIPDEGVSLKDFMKLKFGTDDTDALRKKSEPLRQAGERVGITWNKERRMVNTVNSHCLAELAHTQNRGDAMVSEIFAAYFERGEDIHDTGVLCRLAEKVGVSGAKQCLESGTYRSSVQAFHNTALQSGITSVPHFTIRVGAAEPSRFSGAQSLELFQGVIWQLLQVADIPLGSRVRVNDKLEGDVVGFQGADGDQGCFVVKPRDAAITADAIRASKDKIEVVKAIPPGAEVELGGLSVAELNGRKGQVVRYWGDKGRFEVRLMGDEGAPKALRGDNLTVVRALLPGDVVVLDGLKAAHLNGQRAEVLGYAADKERFEVRFHSDGQVKAVQGDKLRAMSD